MENAAVSGHVQILVDHLHAAGGSLSLEGGQLFVEAPAPLPDELVDRLRAAKPELIAVLAADAGWDADTANLIAWFLGTLAPTGPFELCRGVTILRPSQYWRDLKADIVRGPKRARGFTGALQADLRKLHGLFGPRMNSSCTVKMMGSAPSTSHP